MQRKFFSLNFDNKTALLFGPKDNIVVDVLPAYEVAGKILFCNIDEEVVRNNDAKIEEQRSLIKEQGGINGPLDFLLKNEHISYYFMGRDYLDPSGPLRLYGINNISWEPATNQIYIGACDADPFDEKLLVELGDNRYKGVALYTIIQACYFFMKLFRPEHGFQKKPIHLLATYFSATRKIYERYGFQIVERDKKPLEEAIRKKNNEGLYEMFLTVEAMHRFIKDHNININF
jgi:hypothetical protein